METRFAPFNIKMLPRISMSWDEFIRTMPQHSIALDGVVRGGPRYSEITRHVNFDHHDGVVREATMSTCMQVYFAIKGGLMEAFTHDSRVDATILLNDTDQDTSLAFWLLLRYKLFKGTRSIPLINRLLSLNDRWDITGGAFPINLRDRLVRQHNWIFQPYSELRKSGGLASATEKALLDNLEAVVWRLDQFLIGKGGETPLDIRHEILYDSSQFKIVDEIGGNDARYHLFSKGMNAFISLVAKRPDGRFVYTIGRRSQYISFPVEKLYDDYNIAEGFTRENGWNGSGIIGGSSRLNGSGLDWEALRDITLLRLKQENIT